MSDDVLNKFRYPTARLVRDNTAANVDDENIEPSADEYQAFNAVGKKRERLAFRPLNTPWERQTYRYLLRIR
jgi:hypothetical protein